MIRVTSAAFVLQCLILVPMASTAAAQTSPEATPQPAVFSEALQPALQQVGFTVSRLHIDHWKVSQSWKTQLQSDADSIQQDLSRQLPTLLQQAESSPAPLDAQLRMIQNVDALYDVLVRLTMAADLTEKKNDAAMLDNALQRLESARKEAADQLLRAAALQNQQMIVLQAHLKQDATAEKAPGVPKTIVVDNGVTHRARHRTVHHKVLTHAKVAPKPNSDANHP